jgi:hypothetical protein
MKLRMCQGSLLRQIQRLLDFSQVRLTAYV